jgi:hypothetical protein
MSDVPFDPTKLAYVPPEQRVKPKKQLPKPRFRMPRVRISKKVRIISLILFFIGAFAISGYYAYPQLMKQFSPKEQPPEATVNPNAPPQTVMKLIEDVDTKVSVPHNEYPTVATVSDLKSLSDQAFFNGAKVGDKILIYGAAKQAFLYRPGTKEVIRHGRLEVVTGNESESDTAVLSASTSADTDASEEAVLRVKF